MKSARQQHLTATNNNNQNNNNNDDDDDNNTNNSLNDNNLCMARPKVLGIHSGFDEGLLGTSFRIRGHVGEDFRLANRVPKRRKRK